MEGGSPFIALALKKFGVTPTIIYPAEKEHDSPEGIIVPINGMRIFKKVKVDQEVAEHGFPIYRFSKLDYLGNEHGHIDYKLLSSYFKNQCISINRNILLKILETELGIPVDRQTELVQLQHIVDDEDNLSVTCQLQKNNNIITQNFHFVIGAEGAFSKVRESMWKPSEMTQDLPFGIYSTIVHSTQAPYPGSKTSKPSFLPSSWSGKGIIEMWGKNNVLGIFPISNHRTMVWGTFIPKPTNIIPKNFFENVPVNMFLEEFKEFRGPWESIVLDLKQKESVLLSYPVQVQIHNLPFYHRVGLIGPAAWGFSPLLRGHDLSQAIEDAYVVAECLTSDIPLDLALRKYAVLRTSRWEEIQRIGSALDLSVLSNAGLMGNLSYFLTKLDNSTSRLMERERKMIGMENIKRTLQDLG